MNSRREVWQEAQRDQELVKLIQYLGERGMLSGKGAAIVIRRKDGAVVRWER